MKNYASAVKRIEEAKKKGYRTDVIGVTIPVEKAIRRAQLRAKETGRRIKPDTIIKAHIGSTETFLKLFETGLADSLKLYDNSGSSPILIYDSKDENPIRNVKLFEDFKNKINYAMTKKNYDIKKSYVFTPSEFDKRFKRRCQAASPERQRNMYYDVPDEADEEDLEIARLANKWLHDGKPVD